MRIVDIYEKLNCTRFRIRRTSDLTDYCITGIKNHIQWAGERNFQRPPMMFTAWRLDASQQSCELSGETFGGWFLLSSPSELKFINEIGERKLAESLRESYS